MINVVPYKQEHLVEIMTSGTQESCGFFDEITHQNVVTLLYNGHPIAILGAVELLRGLFQMWALVSKNVTQTPKEFHKTTKTLLEYFMTTRQVRRAQVSVNTDFDMGWRWARKLGFKCEGIMRKYGVDGKDYWLFAKVGV